MKRKERERHFIWQSPEVGEVTKVKFGAYIGVRPASTYFPRLNP